MDVTCPSCKKPVEITTLGVDSSEDCPHCRADLRTCHSCRHFSSYSYHQCKEPEAEEVLDKERNNSCDFFEFSDLLQTVYTRLNQNKEDYLKELDSLFK